MAGESRGGTPTPGPGSPLLPKWINDNESTTCLVCKQDFTLFRRRHHCRRCGLLVCDTCSTRKIALPVFNIDTPVRVCHNCFNYEHANNHVMPKLREGGIFLKVGHPSLRVVVKLDSTWTRLTWRRVEETWEIVGSIDLSDVTQIMEGFESPGYQRGSRAPGEYMFFTVVTSEDTVKFEVVPESLEGSEIPMQTIQRWVDLLRRAVEFVNEESGGGPPVIQRVTRQQASTKCASGGSAWPAEKEGEHQGGANTAQQADQQHYRAHVPAVSGHPTQPK
eukprot:Colp12_sorted_trinity150504_noHs@30916